MLRRAGLPAAVANAHPEVKTAARILLPSNDDDGVASLIRALLRWPPPPGSSPTAPR
ncbi:HAD hydrolase family protein [Nonomuraea jabiensis]|uniref:HAD family hydrolase n=1 Tax=Nonomuraea jabiensis TaxID=882448 RepID=UPI003414896D